MTAFLRLGALLLAIHSGAGLALAGSIFGLQAPDPGAFERVGPRITLTAVFTVPCHPHGPYLVPEEPGEGPAYLLLREAEGAASPVRGLHTTIGNRFALEGYRVTRRSGDHFGDPAWFDVVAWRLLPEGKVWNPVKDDHKVILVAEPATEEIAFSLDPEPDPASFRARDYAADFACGYDAAGKPRTHVEGNEIQLPTRKFDWEVDEEEETAEGG
ncbi:MAG: hypothetical protein AAGF44_01310 [Pseudomonadota bacterium]